MLVKELLSKPTVTFINNLLRVKEVVAINKMDLVDYSEEVLIK
jgi:sulfate adenylyltransferase subunit 1 (EFTu-like GTPase family)